LLSRYDFQLSYNYHCCKIVLLCFCLREQYANPNLCKNRHLLTPLTMPAGICFCKCCWSCSGLRLLLSGISEECSGYVERRAEISVCVRVFDLLLEVGLFLFTTHRFCANNNNSFWLLGTEMILGFSKRQKRCNQRSSFCFHYAKIIFQNYFHIMSDFRVI